MQCMRKAAFVAALGALSVVISVPGTASGTNYTGASGNTNCAGVNEQDNAQMTYYRSSGLTSAMYSAVVWNVNNNVAPTDFTVTEDTSETTTTDVIYYENDYTGTYCGYTWHPNSTGSSLLGIYVCEKLNGSNECDRSKVRFDKSWDVLSTTTTTKRRALVCHETGHSFGLKHPTTSSTTCMNDPVPSSTTTYSSHDVGHINANDD